MSAPRIIEGQRVMATYSTNEFKAGLKLLLDGDPQAIVENEFVKPGKGQAFSRVKLRNLRTAGCWRRPSSPASRWRPPT